MRFERVGPEFVAKLRAAVVEGEVLVSAEDRENYGHDETEDLSHPPEVVVRVRDAGDESLADLIVDLDLADTDRDLEELRDVEAALARLDKGNYGACVKCGAPIPVARLKVYPTAKRCQPCQRIYEQTFAHKGRPSL